MDQVTAACALPGNALLLDCRTLGIRHVPLPSAMRIVVLCTGIQRQLRDSVGGVIYAGTSDIQRNLIASLLGL